MTPLPTGYIMRLDEGINDDNGKGANLSEKNVSPLTGSEVYLLSKETDPEIYMLYSKTNKKYL